MIKCILKKIWHDANSWIDFEDITLVFTVAMIGIGCYICSQVYPIQTFIVFMSGLTVLVGRKIVLYLQNVINYCSGRL